MFADVRIFFFNIKKNGETCMARFSILLLNNSYKAALTKSNKEINRNKGRRMKKMGNEQNESLLF